MKLPEGWEIKTLKEISLDMHQGINTVTDKIKYQLTGKYIIQSKHITKGFLDLSDARLVTSKDYYSYKEKYNPQVGDLLFCNIGTIGSSIVIKKKEEFLIAWNLFLIKLNKRIVDPHYIKFFLDKLNSINYFDRFLTGGTVKFINKTKMGSIKIPVPPLETQKQIVSLLEKVENSKEWRKEADELTKDFLKSVFFEMFGDREKFEQVTLNDIADLSMGGTPSTKEKSYWDNGTVNWMKSGDIKGNYIYSIPQKITGLGHKKSNAKMFPKDTVVIALNGQGKTRGTTAILKVETTSNQSVVGIMIDKEKISSEYLHYNLKTRYSEIRNLTGDSDRSGLNLSILRSFKILLPPIELQNKFASIVKEVEAMKEHQKQSKDQIENLFNALMQKAFKGELKC
jgi:type I restriction enzyme, S subunit